MTHRTCALVHGARVLALLSGLASCGTQYSDPIREEPGEARDPCAAWQTAAECQADALNGCSYQPNPVGCHPDEPRCAPGACRGGDPFVRRVGQRLILDGDPYTFTGTASWGIAWAEDGCTVGTLPSQRAALDRTFGDLVDLRMNVLKVWAFQSYAGASGTDYSSFDRIVAAARRAGVRLIFVLESQHPDCTRGSERDDAWYASGYQQPYAGYTLSLPDYVRGLVEHYRNEPTLLAWEIMHEARADDFSVLDGFARHLSSLIRESDPNHLIALGTDNGDSPGTSRAGSPSNYERLHAHSGIDLLDPHDFYVEDIPLPPSFVELGPIAQRLDKPLFAGATAVDLTATTPEAFATRAALVEAKLVAAFDAGFVGFVYYDYFPDWSGPSRAFDGRPEDPLAGPDGVFVRHAR